MSDRSGMVSQHADWLSLIEISGPFLALPVLEEVFPQGLDKLDTPRKQRLRAAYEEWRDAVDAADPQLEALHHEWLNLVLGELLEYDFQTLKRRAELPEALNYLSPDTGVVMRPDLAVMSGETLRMLIAWHPPGTELESARTGDAWPASPAERMTLLCRATGVRLGLVLTAT